MHDIVWEDFNQDYGQTRHSPDQVLHGINEDPLPDGDIIWLTEADIPDSSSIEIVFKLGDRVSWWKEVKAINHGGATIGKIARDGRRRGPLSFTVPVADVARLVFSKAKFLGWKTEMYAVGNAAQKAGRQLTFSWDKD
jgi:hypothetical protein